MTEDPRDLKDRQLIDHKLMPLVSVVVPVHNRADMVKDAVKSLLDQTYPEIEIIVIDDHSDVDIGNYLKIEFPKENIKCFRNSSNRGVSFSRNKGIQNCTGSYISFLDSDDVVTEKKYEHLIKKAIETKSEYTYGGWVWKNFESGKIRKSRLPDKNTGLIDGLPRWCYNIIPDLIETSAMKRNIFNSDLKSYELFDHQIRLFKNCTISWVPEILSVFRDHEGIRTSSDNIEKIASVDLLFSEHQDFLLQQKRFASRLRLSQGIYDWTYRKNHYRRYFLEAIKLDVFNLKAYYHLTRSFI